ncbi:catalase family protein [Sphingosinicellaceae bacterium]|nr:catalase family protein [Sphingosinicellaceae bacterium]
MPVPVRYTPSVEQPEPDEAETFAAIIDTMKTISATTFKDEGRAIRAVHAKAHALLDGTLTVLGLPPELAQGLFATPATYAAKVRVSTSPGDLLDDHISTPRGLAIKVLGVTGEQLSGNAGDATQDFLLVDGPAFLAPTPKAFLGSLKLLAATTDRAEGLKRAFSATARGIETVLEAIGQKSSTLTGLGGHKLTNPLGETYYSQVPIRYGDYIAKVSAVPVSADITALTDARVDLSGKPDGLREALTGHFAHDGGEWEIRVQLCTDLETMPIEDASKVWPEDEAPYVAVARLTLPPQSSWDAEKAGEDDGVAFAPWHGLVAHQPLGGVMRARRSVYGALQTERSTRSGCPFSEAA